ncbi:MAG: hypothetical protein RLZ98_1059 [Pseudomonadota bacterium]|jgi:tripartite-type tricarboxylate transporter receptor subunit TctC
MRITNTILAVSAVLYAASTCGSAVAQESLEAFYKGRQMKMVIRSSPGGGYDTYARLLAQHITRHIPGKPTMIPINMPGVGGLIAANYVAMVAPKDGSVLTIASRGLPMYQLTGGKKFQGDVRTFNWICDLSDSNPLLVTWHQSPTKTIEDARKRETIIGATGAGSISVQIPVAYNRLLGTKLKVVFGYKGGQDVNLAMERGEVEGRATNNLASWKSTNPEWVADRKLNYLMQLGLKRDAELPDVPLLTDLAKGDPEKEQVARFLTLANVVGRPIATGAGVPADRVAALREACKNTMSDQQFRKAAGEQRAEIGFRPGAEVQSIITEIVDAPQKLVAAVNDYMTPRGQEAAKRVASIRKVESAIISVGAKGATIVIRDDGRETTAKVSGKRTRITLGGKVSKRGDLKAGMTCLVEYEGAESEASSVSCR